MYSQDSGGECNVRVACERRQHTAAEGEDLDTVLRTCSICIDVKIGWTSNDASMYFVSDIVAGEGRDV